MEFFLFIIIETTVYILCFCLYTLNFFAVLLFCRCKSFSLSLANIIFESKLCNYIWIIVFSSFDLFNNKKKEYINTEFPDIMCMWCFFLILFCFQCFLYLIFFFFLIKIIFFRSFVLLKNKLSLAWSGPIKSN